MIQLKSNHSPRPSQRPSPQQAPQKSPNQVSHQVPQRAPYLVSQQSQRHNRRTIAVVLIVSLLGQLIMISACTAMPVDSTVSTKGMVTDRANVTQSAGSDGVKYSYEFTGAFDTVIQLIGYAPDKPTFDRWVKAAEQQFRELHQLYDAYHVYNGINNIKSINDQAGKSPVIVDKRVMGLLTNTRKWRAELSKVLDLTIGPVVSLWAEYRTIALADPEKASPPTEERLASTMLLMGADELILDLQAQTIYLPRVGMKLDVGAVAKGYATELVAQSLTASGVTSMIINAGGSSVRMIGKPANPERKTWNIAIQNPEVLLPSQEYIPQTAEPTLTVIRTTDTSVVTSGDYQRYYNVEDQIYHHLISPEDGQPARYYRAVTVMTRDSGLADFLSTALFLLPYDQSRELVDSLPDVAALWVFADGQVELTPNMAAVADPLADLNRG